MLLILNMKSSILSNCLQMLSFLIHLFQGEGGINAEDSLINLCMIPIIEWLVLLIPPPANKYKNNIFST